MNENERNEHFKGFAELLWQELMYMHKSGWIDVSSDGLDEEDINRYQQIIAQRAYDLVFYTITSVEKFDFDAYILAATDEEAFTFIHKAITEIPDLTEWPKL